ncbi:hypothetical protein [Aquihabitans sp. McL0605]|uniref:hypothetical protein n=1 Tax=Aquihabitans sp. McL0605 TaxID=3415671 RepID=UPI003CEF3364
MWLFGIALVVLGVFGMVAIRFAIGRYGPGGGVPGPAGEERAQQNYALARWIAIAGAAVLVLDTLWWMFS